MSEYDRRSRRRRDTFRLLPYRLALAVLASMLVAAAIGCEKSGSDDPDEKRDEQQEESRDEPKRPPSAESDPRPESKPVEPTEEQESGEAAGAEKSDAEAGGAGRLGKGTSEQKKLLAEAKAKFLKDNLDAAEPLFQKVIDQGEMTGTKASAYIALGQIYVESGEPKKAVELLESIPEEGKKIVEVRLILARAHAAAQDLDAAIAEYQQVIDLQPHYIFAYPAIGALYNEKGDKKKAAEMYLRYENKMTEMARTLENPEETKTVDRLNVLDIFSAVNDQRAVKAVKVALDDPKTAVRAKAATTAGQMGITSVRTKLEYMAKKDKTDRVRMAARSALRKLPDEKTKRQ